jgi:hypothetical protein
MAKVNIENARANDTVGQEFEANYIPKTTDKDLEDARKLMAKLLNKYGSRSALEADESDWAKYKEAMYIVYSRSKDAMEAASKAREDLIKRKNLLSQFFEENTEILFGLSEWQRINLRKYTDAGLLIDQEYLWDLLRELGKEGAIKHLANVANYIYLDTSFLGGVREDYDALKKGPVRSIYHRPTCKSKKTVHPGCGSKE